MDIDCPSCGFYFSYSYKDICLIGPDTYAVYCPSCQDELDLPQLEDELNDEEFDYILQHNSFVDEDFFKSAYDAEEDEERFDAE